MNMNQSPCKKELALLLRQQNDEAGHHIVWVDTSGWVHISRLSETMTPAGFEKCYPSMLLRLETLECGNGYVGSRAADDDKWVDELFRDLVQQWRVASGSSENSVVIEHDFVIHPACALMPQIGERNFQLLKESIRTIGLLEPILLWDGQVIDGRARLRACKEMGLETAVSEIELDGVLSSGEAVDPWSLVWAYHMNRKHYEEEQVVQIKIAFDHAGSMAAESHKYIETRWRRIAKKFDVLNILSLFRPATRLRFANRSEGVSHAVINN